MAGLIPAYGQVWIAVEGGDRKVAAGSTFTIKRADTEWAYGWLSQAGRYRLSHRTRIRVATLHKHWAFARMSHFAVG